jgi:hypothetical protein
MVVELALLAAVVHLFGIEEERGLLPLMGLVVAGFVVHSLLPVRHRLHFFLLLSLTAFWLLLGLTDGTWLIVVVAAFIGLCHLALSFRLRVALILAAGVLLAALRAGKIWSPLPSTVWPVLSSILMFRMILYLYELRHQKTPVPLAHRCSYFFLLPNVCFPLFPVVGYRPFVRNYLRGDETENQQLGVQWISNGVLHLLLYRVVRFHLVPDHDTFENVAQVAMFVVSGYLLYLQVSGQFHIAVGILRLFGFHLPRTHNLYFLAANFGDIWRRINIYWKDFVVRIAYNPIFVRVHRRGFRVGLAAATAWAFVVTWALHVYQTFWLRGVLSLRWQDALFWGALGVLVTIWSLREAASEKRSTSVKSVSSFRSSITVAAGTTGTFLTMALLWSFWSSPSAAEWLSIWRLTGDAPWRGALGVLGLVVVTTLGYAGLLAAGARRWLSGDQLGAGSFTRSATVVSAGLLMTLGVALLPRPEAGSGPLLAAVASLRQSGDQQWLARNYYEDLLTDGASSLDAMRPDRRFAGLELAEFWADVLSRFPFSEDILALEAPPHLKLEVLGATMSFNEFGMHDKSYQRTKPVGVFRIALIGSSLPMGLGVPTAKTFENLLEDSLNASGDVAPRFEVLNFSALAAFPLERLLLLEKRALPFRPDAALYVAHHNEVEAATATLARLSTMRPRRMPFEFLTELMAKARIGRFDDERTAQERLQPFSEELLSRTYRRIVARCSSDDVVPIWVYLPILGESPEQAKKARRLKRLAMDAGFLTIDLSGVYGNESIESLMLAGRDVHLSEKGHGLVAKRLSRDLTALTFAGLERFEQLASEATGPSYRDDQSESLYLPHSTVYSHYDENPDGYYASVEPPLDEKWQLRVEPNAAASFTVSPETGALRVAVTAANEVPFSIQLNQPLLTLHRHESYELSFEARAEAPRSLSVGVAEAHEPWQSVGLFQVVELSSEWQSFRFAFSASKDEPNARIHFDAGGSEADVEFSEVTLRRQSDGEPIEPNLPRRFAVEYRMGELGCRGNGYSVSPRRDTLRVLAMGGSYVLGEGVHEQDTFVRRLEAILIERRGASPSRKSIEVINCGAIGYGLREQRKFYENVAAALEPDLVLIGIGADDIALPVLPRDDGNASVAATELSEWARSVARDRGRLILVLLRGPTSSGADAVDALAGAVATAHPEIVIHVIDVPPTSGDRALEVSTRAKTSGSLPQFHAALAADVGELLISRVID